MKIWKQYAPVLFVFFAAPSMLLLMSFVLMAVNLSFLRRMSFVGNRVFGGIRRGFCDCAAD